MKETGKSLSELAMCMKTFPQILINVDVKKSQRLRHWKMFPLK